MCLGLRVPELSFNCSRHKGPLLLCSPREAIFCLSGSLLSEMSSSFWTTCRIRWKQNHWPPLVGDGLTFYRLCPYLGQFGSKLFSSLKYYHSLKNSPFDRERGEPMLCPFKICSHSHNPSALFVSFESPVYFGNSAITPEVPLMSTEFNILCYIMEKLFQFRYQHFLDVPRGLSVGFCACGCWFVWMNFF
jgi:hypothetical protein